MGATANFSCVRKSALRTESCTRTYHSQRQHRSFFDFVRGSLLPNLLPFDGANPRSVVIMDNLAVHHTQEIIDLFMQAEVLLLFLPPYSPDLNPIEETVSFVKAYLRRHDTLLQTTINPVNIIKAAFNSISPDHCTSWIAHSGYANYY